ncbi:hypothetical protein ACQKWADRAFT_118958 [Trichoderma austrokoningii]
MDINQLLSIRSLDGSEPLLMSRWLLTGLDSSHPDWLETRERASLVGSDRAAIGCSWQESGENAFMFLSHMPNDLTLAARGLCSRHDEQRARRAVEKEEKNAVLDKMTVVCRMSSVFPFGQINQLNDRAWTYDKESFDGAMGKRFGSLTLVNHRN